MYYYYGSCDVSCLNTIYYQLLKMLSSESGWKGQEHNLDRIKKLSEMGVIMMHLNPAVYFKKLSILSI